MIHTYLANEILNLAAAQITHISGTGECYLGFSSSAPNADGSNFSEPASSSYERIRLAVTEALKYTNKWTAVKNGTVSNIEEFTSRECLDAGGWPEFTHFGIFDAKEGGHLLFSDLLRDPDGEIDPETGLYPVKTMKVNKNEVAVFREGMLQLTLV